jgi:hypothetical protein
MQAVPVRCTREDDMAPDIKKFVRTPHIRGSRFQRGDHDLEAVPFEELQGKHLVVEEKMDGANCGISFTEDGELFLQSRGHYLHGGPREKQFNLLKQWATSRQTELFCALGSRYVAYGEWMFAKHTFFYDALPHYFMEFDVLDTERNAFLSTDARAHLLREAKTTPVLVVAAGAFASLNELSSLVKRSSFITDDRNENLRLAAMAAGQDVAEVFTHTDVDERMEGLYVKWEEDGVVKGRYKFVRQSFTNAILDQETHWHDRPIVQNRLLPGAYDRMFA